MPMSHFRPIRPSGMEATIRSLPSPGPSLARPVEVRHQSYRQSNNLLESDANQMRQGSDTCGTINRPGGNAVDPDSKLPPLKRKTAGDAVHSGFGSGCMHLVPGRSILKGRTDVDDARAVRRFAQVRESRLAHCKCPDSVDFHHCASSQDILG